MCGAESSMPPKGFPVNNLATSLMAEPPKDVSRSEACETLKINLSHLEDLKQKLSFELKDGESILNEICSEQIKHIHLKKDELIKSITEKSIKLTQKVNDFKQECVKNYVDMYETKQRTKLLIVEIDVLVKQQRD